MAMGMKAKASLQVTPGFQALTNRNDGKCFFRCRKPCQQIRTLGDWLIRLIGS